MGLKTQLATTSACSSPVLGKPSDPCSSFPDCSGDPLPMESLPGSNIQIPAPFNQIKAPLLACAPTLQLPSLSSEFPLCFACPSQQQFAHCNTVTAAHLLLALEGTGMTVVLAKALKPN